MRALGLLRRFAGQTTRRTPSRFPSARPIELALEHSGVMGIAAINQWRSQKAYQELRNNYIPQLTIGSGLGYSYGFPLTLEGSAPSLANFTSTQSLFNPALRQFIKAAKIDWSATSQDVQDKRNAVILDTALTYAQLEQLTGKIKALTEAQAAAEKAQFVSEQRLQQGVDSKLEVTKSQLLAARIRLRIAEAQGQTDVLARAPIQAGRASGRVHRGRAGVDAATAADFAGRRSAGPGGGEQPAGETGGPEGRGGRGARQRRAQGRQLAHG